MSAKIDKSLQALDDTVESMFGKQLNEKNNLQTEKLRNNLNDLQHSLDEKSLKPISRLVKDLRDFLEDEIAIEDTFGVIEKINQKTNNLLDGVENNKQELSKVLESNRQDTASITQTINDRFNSNETLLSVNNEEVSEKNKAIINLIHDLLKQLTGIVQSEASSLQEILHKNEGNLSSKLKKLHEDVLDNEPLDKVIDKMTHIITSENDKLNSQLVSTHEKNINNASEKYKDIENSLGIINSSLSNQSDIIDLQVTNSIGQNNETKNIISEALDNSKKHYTKGVEEINSRQNDNLVQILKLIKDNYEVTMSNIDENNKSIELIKKNQLKNILLIESLIDQVSQQEQVNEENHVIINKELISVLSIHKILLFLNVLILLVVLATVYFSFT